MLGAVTTVSRSSLTGRPRAATDSLCSEGIRQQGPHLFFIGPARLEPLTGSQFEKIVVLTNSDLIDLGVAVPLPFQTSIVGSLGCRFRVLPEPGGVAARDPRTPPSTRRSAALRQATETDSGRSIAVGLAVRSLEQLAIQRLCRQSLDRHRLAPERLSVVLGLEGPTW